MKHSLQLKLSQHLTLTPQLQQSIRLLQLSTVELNQELERYLADTEDAPSQPLPPGAAPEPTTATAPEENRDEPQSFAEEHGFGEEHSGTPSSNRRDDDDRDDFTQFAAAEPTLQEHLEQQIAL